MANYFREKIFVLILVVVMIHLLMMGNISKVFKDLNYIEIRQIDSCYYRSKIINHNTELFDGKCFDYDNYLLDNEFINKIKDGIKSLKQNKTSIFFEDIFNNKLGLQCPFEPYYLDLIYNKTNLTSFKNVKKLDDINWKDMHEKTKHFESQPNINEFFDTIIGKYIPNKELHPQFGLLHIYKCQVYFSSNKNRMFSLAIYLRRNLCNESNIFYKFMYNNTYTVLFRFKDEGLKLDLMNDDNKPLIPYFISSGFKHIVTGKYRELLFIPRSMFDHINKNQPYIYKNMWNNKTQWFNRENKIVFRGKATNIMRINASQLTKKYTDYVDIKIICTSNDDATKNNIVCGKEMNYYEQMNYRYILNIDGHTIADRLSGLFRLGNVIFNYENEDDIYSKYWSYWYYHLKKNIHYYSFKNIPELEALINDIIINDNTDHDSLYQMTIKSKLNSIKHFNLHTHNCFTYHMLSFYNLMSTIEYN